MADQWYYTRDSQKLGPVTSEQLKQLANSGELKPTDLIWKEGMKEWVEAGKAKGLIPPAKQSSPETPPAPSPAPSAGHSSPPQQKPPLLPQTPIQRSPTPVSSAQIAPVDRKQLLEKSQQLRQAVTQCVLGSDSHLPTSQSISSIRTTHSQLQEQLARSQDRAQQLRAAKAQYDPLENSWEQKQRELRNAESRMDQFARPLGSTAFDAHLAGGIPTHPSFAARFALHQRIESLRKEHDQLAPSGDAGMLQKTKAKAQQLLVVGKIKIEEMKIGGQDTEIGKSLIASNAEQVVACGRTADVLGQISQQRAVIATLRSELDAACAPLESKKQELCCVFGLSSISSRTLDAEIQQCDKLTRQAQKEMSTLEEGIPDTLLADAGMPTAGPLPDLLNELRHANEQLAAATRKGGASATMQDAGTAALAKVRHASRMAADAVNSPNARGLTTKVRDVWRNLSGFQKGGVIGAAALLLVGVVYLALPSANSHREVGTTNVQSTTYTPDELLALIEKDSKAAEGQLGSKWITVTGTVLGVEYPGKVGPHYDGQKLVSDYWLPMCLKDTDSAISLLSPKSQNFTVQFVYEGSKSGGTETESVSRGDTITIKGKVEVVSPNAVGLDQCEIVSVRHR